MGLLDLGTIQDLKRRPDTDILSTSCGCSYIYEYTYGAQTRQVSLISVERLLMC